VNSGSELPIDDADHCGLFPPDRRTQFQGGRDFDKTNAPSIEQRHDLLSTVRRRITRYDGKNELVLLRCFAHLIDSNNGSATPDTQPDQS
jgi:hypothetical protein